MNGTIEPPRITDYDLLRLIGRGGYGDVWLARGVTGVYRAIKIVWRNRFADSEPFEREFNGLKEFAVVSLAEPSQLALLHVGRCDDSGYFYYVMELADDAAGGTSIRPDSYAPLTLKALRERQGRLPAAEVLAVAIELGQSLACLHARGLVHRDIKPSNGIVVQGRAKLADIGLVSASSATSSYVGTDGFVAPEGPGQPPADVYALGKLLYELSTGLDRRQYPQLPADLSRAPDRRMLFELNETLLRACDPDPARRHPDGAALLADLRLIESGGSLRRRRRRRQAAVLAAVVACAGALGLAGAWWRSGGPAQTAAIAVLPFANLSEGAVKDAFFADGVQEDILANLAHIGAFRVVSRTTVMPYRDTKKSLRQIARELGVDYVLEGSVQRTDRHVRVNGQLIDARSDRLLWARAYDRDLTDIFAIQSEIAGQIAGALDLTLHPSEQSLLDRRPTANIAAYDLYLRARALKNEHPSSLDEREALLRKAVQFDPAFAEAWGELAEVEAFAYFSGEDPAADRLAKATAAIGTATRLAPDSFGVIRSLGTYRYYAHRDYAGAREQYAKLARLQPNDPTIAFSLALIERRQGRWDRAAEDLRRAVALDPANIECLRELRLTLAAGRRYAEAMAVQRRLIDLRPDDPLEEPFVLAEMAFAATGSTREAEDFFRHLAPELAESPRVLAMRKAWALEIGDAATAIALDRRQPYFDDLGWSRYLQALGAAAAYVGVGDGPGARARIAGFPEELRQKLQAEPDNPSLWSALGSMEALLGHRTEALRAAHRAIELMPVERDAVDGMGYRDMLVVTEAWLGERERAIAELSRLEKVPDIWRASGHSIHGAVFLTLRAEPGFQRLLNDPRSQQALF